jgi:hypothetical protein
MRWLSILVIVGCAPAYVPRFDHVVPASRAGEATCAENVEALSRAFHVGDGAWGGELGYFLRDRCVSDGWSAAARACVDDAAYEKCLGRTLAGWQRARLVGVVASDHRFDLAMTPHSAELACGADCEPPAPTEPCEQAAQRMGRDLGTKFGGVRVPSFVWFGLTGVLLDQCRALEWPVTVARCFGEHGIVAECTNQLSPTKKHNPEILIAMWLNQVERSFP